MARQTIGVLNTSASGCLLGVLLCVCPSDGVAQAPTLDETTHFIVTKMARTTRILSTASGGAEGGISTTEDVTLSDDGTTGCTLGLVQHSVVNKLFVFSGGNSRVQEDNVFSVKLAIGNFVLGSVRVKTGTEANAGNQGFVAAVELKEPVSITRHWVKQEQHLRRWRTTRDEFINDSLKDKYFYFEDQETASRVAKAIDHAVELCGGAKDPF